MRHSLLEREGGAPGSAASDQYGSMAAGLPPRDILAARRKRAASIETVVWIVVCAVCVVLLVVGASLGFSSSVSFNFDFFAGGQVAVGAFALGTALSAGVFAVAFVSSGLVSIGVVSCGFVSIGVFSTGFIAIGVVANGYIATGVMASGRHARGLAALGSSSSSR